MTFQRSWSTNPPLPLIVGWSGHAPWSSARQGELHELLGSSSSPKIWEMFFSGWERHMDRPTCQKTQGMLWGCITQVSLAKTGIWDDPFLHCCTHKSAQLSFTGKKNGIYLSLPNAVFNLCPKLQWDIKSDRICCYSLFLVFHQILLLNHSAVAMLRRYCRQVTRPEHSKRLANEEWNWFPIGELKALEGIKSEEKKKSWSVWLESVSGVWLHFYPPDTQVNYYFILLKILIQFIIFHVLFGNSNVLPCPSRWVQEFTAHWKPKTLLMFEVTDFVSKVVQGTYFVKDSHSSWGKMKKKEQP